MKRDEDVNSKNQIVNWNVEIWEWVNYLRSETKITYKQFKKKVDAIKWIENVRLQGLTLIVKVDRLTFDNEEYPLLPSRKTMYEVEYDN